MSPFRKRAVGYLWLLAAARRSGVRAIAGLAGRTGFSRSSGRAGRSFGSGRSGRTGRTRCPSGTRRPGRARGSRGPLAGWNDDRRGSRLGRRTDDYRTGRTASAASGWRVPEEVAQHHRNHENRHDDRDGRPRCLAVHFACVKSHCKTGLSMQSIGERSPAE